MVWTLPSESARVASQHLLDRTQDDYAGALWRSGELFSNGASLLGQGCRDALPIRRNANTSPLHGAPHVEKISNAGDVGLTAG